MNIYWSYKEQRMVTSLHSKGAQATLTWVLRDVVPLYLYVVTKQDSSTQPYIAGELPVASFSIRLEGKISGEYDDDPLYCCTEWTLVGTGSSAYYRGNLRLNNPSIIARMEGDSSSSMDVESLSVVTELTMESTETEHFYSTKFNVNIIPDVIRDGDVCPIPVDYSSSSSVSSISSSSVSSVSSSSTSSVNSSSSSSST